MPDDVLLNKVATIERCLARIREEYQGREEELETNQTRQDAIVLNLQRACEASIDLAMHLVRRWQLGLPQESRQAFAILEEGGFLEPALSERMQAMVGFRNVAVHNYRALSLEVVRTIIEHRLDDFATFTGVVVKQSGFNGRDDA